MMKSQATLRAKVSKYQVALERAPALFSAELNKRDTTLVKTYYEAVLGLGISFNETERTQLWPKLLLEQPHRFAQTKHWREQHAQFAPLLQHFLDLVHQWAAGTIKGQSILSALANQADDTQEYLAYFTELAIPLLAPETLEDYWLGAQLTAYASLPPHAKELGLGLLLNDLSEVEGDALLHALPTETQSCWLSEGHANWLDAMRRVEQLAKIT